MELGGLEYPDQLPKRILGWEGKKLAIGDEILIRIRANVNSVPPERVSEENEEKDRERRREYYERLKKEFEGRA